VFLEPIFYFFTNKSEIALTGLALLAGLLSCFKVILIFAQIGVASIFESG